MIKLKDYHRKNYTNPFFRKVKRGVASRGHGFSHGGHIMGSWRGKLVLFLLIIAMGGSLYFLFYSPYFTIKNITVSGLQKISESEIRDIINAEVESWRFFIFKQDNIFIFDKNALENKINLRYALDSLKIDKKLPGDLSIEIREKTSAFIWKTADKYYYADWNGVIIREIPSEEISGYPGNQSGAKMAMVSDDSNTAVAIKESILTREKVQTVVDLQNNLARIAGFQILNLAMVNRDDSTVKCPTGEGWEAYFSLTNDLNAQLDKLNAFLKEKSQDGRKGLQYVDLRFEDRVYYK